MLKQLALTKIHAPRENVLKTKYCLVKVSCWKVCANEPFIQQKETQGQMLACQNQTEFRGRGGSVGLET